MSDERPTLTYVHFASSATTTMRGVLTETRAVVRDGKVVGWSKPKTRYVRALDVFGRDGCDCEECKSER